MTSGPSPIDAPDPRAALEALAARLAARFGPARAVVPLAPDASVRAFFRVERDDAAPAVALVDVQGGAAALDRMVAARELLETIDVRVPRLLDRDDAIPALLFEDLGDTLLADALPAMPRARQRDFYAAAGAFAGRIASLGSRHVDAAHPLSFPRLHRDRLRWELALWATQDVAGLRGVTDPGLFRELAHVSDRICDVIGSAPPQLAHRDFHARNLMVTDGPEPGVVDFQDTLFAPPYYDLASLVRDPYVEPGPDLVAAAARAFADATDAGDPLDDPLFAWVALQRDLKAIGTYAFQARWRKRTRFLDYIPAAERLALASVDALPEGDRSVVRHVLARIGF